MVRVDAAGTAGQDAKSIASRIVKAPESPTAISMAGLVSAYKIGGLVGRISAVELVGIGSIKNYEHHHSRLLDKLNGVT